MVVMVYWVITNWSRYLWGIGKETRARTVELEGLTAVSSMTIVKIQS